MIKPIKLPKIFFGWWTVLGSGILCLWGYGYYSYGISALFIPIASELGFTRAQTSVAASIGRFEGGFEALLAGWITDKFGPKWIVFTGVLLGSISLACIYFIDSLWSFYLVWGFLFGTALNMALAIPLDTAISNWFVKKRGVAISIKWVFSGISGVVILPLIAWLIQVVGWRMTCAIGGVVWGFIGLPIVWLFLKSHRPEHYGLLPDGAKIEEGITDKDTLMRRGIEYAAEVLEVEFNLKQTLRTPTYWLLISVQAVYGLVAPAINIHCIPFLTDMKIDSMLAASMMAIMIAASIPARFIAGYIADRVDIQRLRFVMMGAFLFQALGIVVFLIHQTTAMIYVWYILYGFGMGACLTLNPAITARYYGRKAFGSIRGTSSLLLTPVGVAAPIYAGWVFDTTGAYTSAFMLFAILLTVASIILPFVRPPEHPAGPAVAHVNKIS
jgi:MFS transporter, OFA family, oxalate/formate antiporter